MLFAHVRRPALSMTLSFALLAAIAAAAPPAVATEMDDDHRWVQAGVADFYAGEFRGATIDPESGSVVLGRLDRGAEYAPEGEFVSPEFKAERPFDALFVSWRDESAAGGRVEVLVRVADERKVYSGWFSPAKESDRVFAKDQRYIQYKVRLSSESGRTTPMFKSIAFYYTDLYEEMKNLEPEPVDYQVSLAAPEIVERDAWGAAKPSAAYTPQSPKQIILHHSWLPNASQYTGAGTIRGIQDYHMNDPKTGWIDIGYHFLIGPDGKIFRGRPETALGSHCVPNTDKIGICCIGDYDPGKDPLTPAMYASVQKLVPYLAAKYKISKVELYGHRDFSPKTCPGETIYAKIPELKNLIRKTLGK